jgi:amino acid adenylation domain-containing protein
MKQTNSSFKLSADKLELLDLLLADEGLIEAPAALTISPRPHSSDPAPLSFAQQRLWFLEALVPDSGLYNTPMVLQLNGRLDETVLAQACQALVQRHESLRTTFTAVAGIPQQLIHKTWSVTMESHTAPADGVEAALQTAVQLPFDLENGPLLRFHLFHVSPTEHFLLLVFHHIIFDGWSANIILDDLVALYEAFNHHREPQLPDLPIQYADYAVWQRDWLTGQTLQNQLDYWQQQLGGELPFLQLPTDKPRPAVKTHHGSFAYVELPAQLSDQLIALSKQTGATPFMVMLAAFKVLLYHYTAQEDILVGTPIANRQHTELERLVGFFVNTLVLRSQVNGRCSFRQLLAQVRQTATAAYDHQDVPFEKLVEILQPERNLSYDPLFQVMFNYQEGDSLERALPDLTFSLLHMDNGRAQFDLTLTVSRKHGRFLCSFNYNTDLFSRESICQKLDHWQTVLAGIVANPDQPIGQLCLLTPAEKQQILVDWNDTAVPLPATLFAHELFAEWAEQTPNALALIYGQQQWSYRELNGRANQLAHALQGRGIGPESKVGIFIDRSPEMVLAVLAVFKAGGAYVPLDPTYPADRLSYMVADANLALVLTTEKMGDRLPETAVPTLPIDQIWADQVAHQPVHNPVSGLTLENLAYVIYTSGSTGRPKGVGVTHRGLANFGLAMAERCRVSANSRVLQFASFSFDASTADFVIALQSGAALVLADKDELLVGPSLVQLMQEQAVTCVTLPPSVLALLSPDDFPALQTIISAGEASSAETVAKWAPGRHFVNAYGPTETTIGATTAVLTATDPRPVIGRPLPNTKMFVLNAQLQPVPVGVAGEIHIGGRGLARGYLNRPDLTAEKFIPNPFGQNGVERLYKTGDLGRYLPDGRIEFLGRIDHQVKVRGFRIELGEVEAALRQHTAVHDALVLALDQGHGPRLVAYVVGAAAAMEDLRPFLSQSLPSYMVPSAFVPLERFPQTPNGKIDRKALPEPDGSFAAAPEETFVPPQDPLEFQLAQIWQEVLQRPAISVVANYFDIGGHSLQAVTLFAAIEKQLGLRLPVSLLFQAPTIRQLAAAIRQREEVDLPQWSSLVPIQPLGHRTPFFCVHGGAGHVFHYRDLALQLGTERPFYGLQPKMDETTHQSVYHSVEEMAAHYVREIKMLQPKGPYLLSGFCFGGVVAYEMAQQLLQNGDEVGLLAFIDPSSPQNKPKNSQSALLTEVLTTQVTRHKNNMAELALGARLQYLWQSGRNRLRRHWLDTTRSLVTLWRFARGQVLRLYINWQPKVPARFKDFYFMHVISTQAIRWYYPQKYPGEAVLFYSTLESSGDETMGWGDLPEDGLRLYAIKTTHLGILKRPSIDQVAEKLQKHLEQIP